MVIGVLAVQGAFIEHEKVLESLGIEHFEIRQKKDLDRLNLVLKNLGSTEHRTARFVSCISCTFPNGDRIDTRGTCEGTIQYGPTGENGFGYDPIFQPDGYSVTFADMTADEKNAISHRGRATKKLEEFFSCFEG